MPILLTGESGTGKEVFAAAIHNASNRRGAPFVKVNCAAIPRELLESELFGYETGTFSGAVSYTHLDVYKRQALQSSGGLFLLAQSRFRL